MSFQSPVQGASVTKIPGKWFLYGRPIEKLQDTRFSPFLKKLVITFLIIMFILLGESWQWKEGIEGRMCCFCLFCLEEQEGNKGVGPGCSPNSSVYAWEGGKSDVP